MLKLSFYSSIISVFTIFLLLGCNSTATNVTHFPELLDSRFPDYAQYPIETEEQIFNIDEGMIAFVRDNITNGGSDKEKLTQLAHAIFDRAKLSLSYRAGANTTAMETFYDRTANCLSLTILTYSMTEYLKMHSVFQNVKIPEYWTRRGGKTLINQHVNLKVHPRNEPRVLLPQKPIIIDFDPQQGARKLAADAISKSEVVSFFYANKAADYMVENKPSKAYAYLRAAIEHNPINSGAWLNLGVLSSQNRFYKEAESYYAMAIKLRPSFTSAYENLAILYARQGDTEKADGILDNLHQKRLKNPYYHVVKGDIAMEKENFKDAIKHYKKAIGLNQAPHEFHFSIAKAYYRLGDMENTQRYLEKAKRRAGDEMQSDRYASKISTILALR